MVRPVLPLIPDFVAVIVVVPTPVAVARPELALMVAFAVLLEDHAEDPVITEVLASVKVPVATYCWVAA